ncbi:PA-phosphatase [Mycolicibacterium neworleansense]|uniref:PAP2 superfamily protein n=2 Tax=Mycolicibacterium neworleansense TaxID=146018 RepID=A0A0H5RR01_9MYCO|nr:PA-phosphatase [Mycolicibacterium neworleansense]CRZ16368.1 PAP2 superfamily protein [Mycolicibacterium neworleansense]
MVLLGWAVRGAPLPVDSWFQRLGSDLGSAATALLGVTTPAVLTAALVIGIVVAVRQHRNRLALAMVVSPLVAIAIVRVLKPVFGREKGGALAYPSGHTTFLVVVTGLLVLVAGVGLWSVIVAAGLVLLGMFGLGMTFHYFTDTVGGLLLGTSVVGMVALWACDGRSGTVGSPASELR